VEPRDGLRHLGMLHRADPSVHPEGSFSLRQRLETRPGPRSASAAGRSAKRCAHWKASGWQRARQVSVRELEHNFTRRSPTARASPALVPQRGRAARAWHHAASAARRVRGRRTSAPATVRGHTLRRALWREVTVHPDHHVSVQYARYSAPSTTCPTGHQARGAGHRRLPPADRPLGIELIRGSASESAIEKTARARPDCP